MDATDPAARPPAEPEREIIVCACVERGRIAPDRLAAALAALGEEGVAHRVVPDLCYVAAKEPGRLRAWAASDPLLVAACHPRAIRALFAAAAAAAPAAAVAAGPAIIVNLLDPAGPSLLARAADGFPAGGPRDDPAPAAGWPAWFPVIDRERCVDCGQCLSFCLFGVYARAAGAAGAAGDAGVAGAPDRHPGRVVVVHPEQCKFNCPACSRVCPELAVIFPKLADEPYNGAEPRAVAAGGGVGADGGAADAVGLKALGAVDLYDLLRSRQELRRRRLLKKSVWRQARRGAGDGAAAAGGGGGGAGGGDRK